MFNTIPEIVTGISDLILGCSLIILVISLWKKHRSDKSQALSSWLWGFVFLSLTAFGGFTVHTFFWIPPVYNVLWQPVYFFLGLAIACFFLGTLGEIRKTHFNKTTQIMVLAVPVLSFLVTLVFPGSFLVFIIYETIALVFILISYLVLLIRQKDKGLLSMFFALLVFTIVAGFQAMQDVKVLFAVQFDPHGLLHTTQIAIPVLFYLGLRNPRERKPVTG